MSESLNIDDASVLCSIVLAAEKDATLRQVIGVADHLNWPPTLELINRSLARLMAHGDVTASGRCLNVSSRVREFHAPHACLPARLLPQKFLEFLTDGSTASTRPSPAEPLQYSEAEFTLACAQWHAKARSIIRALDRTAGPRDRGK